jgi:hypothetical protein
VISKGYMFTNKTLLAGNFGMGVGSTWHLRIVVYSHGMTLANSAPAMEIETRVQ